MHNRHFALWGLSLILSFASVIKTQAQLIPDNTLGEENSIVTPVNSLKNRIDGGAIRGSNLLHSFQEFNIDNGQSVYFDNPGAIANILTRVTGSNTSSILGKLGVLGNANLFLINPNGIIFGQNASLDISGSFKATTTPNILFDNGWEFSATNPQAPPLLEINLTPGLQYPSHQVHHIQNPLSLDTINLNITQGDITNKGNLSVGEDLNLVGRNLNLIGKLNAGGNLKLQASNTLQIRDYLTKPFIASAGNDLLLQGNQSLDISALNHPDSGLFSGNDSVLRSSAAVLGDAHYFSGGNFKIEQLDGNLGDLESPKDPIIRASGDVSFDSYTGASLHILAGGSVNITGDVTITGADGANGLEETVTLSNGESLEINGKTQPTLDIRAGTTAFGIVGVTGTGSFTPGNPNTLGNPSSNNIVVGGNIKIDSADGLVFLTNQYNANPNLSGGDILIQGDIDTSRDFGNAGNILLDSTSQVIIPNGIEISSITEGSGQGGNIQIIANDSVAITNSSLLVSSRGLGDAGNISIETGKLTVEGITDAAVISANNDNIGRGGDIDINASESIDMTGSLVLIFTSSTGAGDAGNLNIDTKQLILDDGVTVFSNTDVGGGKGGNININATDSVKLSNDSDLYTRALGDSKPGDINITTGQLILENGVDISSGSITSIAGNISLLDLTSLQLNQNSKISASTTDGEAGDIVINASNEVKLEDNSTIASGAIGNGEAGFLSIVTDKLTINDNSQATVSSIAKGNAGEISIQAADVSLTNLGTISAQTFSGTSGNITLKNLKTLSLSGSSSINATTNNGTAGNVEINATDSIQLENASKIVSEATGNGTAGNMSITTGQLTLSNLSQANVSSKGNGSAGSVSIDASDVLLTNQSQIAATTKYGTGTDGHITLDNLNSLELLNSQISASTINAEAGDIEINAKDLVNISDNSKIISEAIGSGIAGELTINTNQLTMTDSSQANVSSKGDGNAGSILINADDVNLANQAEISATTKSGIGGDIQLENLTTLSLSENSSISANTTDGKAGNIEINTTDSIQVENGSKLASESIGDGTAGNITISTNQFLITDNSQANVSSKANGSAGSVFINASDVFLSNQSQIAATTAESGSDGNITLNNLNSLELSNSKISASTMNGEAGDINISATDSVKLSNSSSIVSKATGEGKAGELAIATNQLTMINSQANVSSKGGGSAGSVFISTNNVNLASQAEISATTESGIGGDIQLENLTTLSLSENSSISANTTDGEAGNIEISATDSIEVENSSRLASESIGDGTAGYITINTNQFRMTDNSQANVSSKGNGSAGSILINASDIFLSNQAEIAAKTTESGTDGNITLNNLNSLELFNSLISASTINGEAGDININATDSIKLSDSSSIASEAKGSGIAGELTIITNQLTMNNSQANVSSQGDGSAGRIYIDATDVNLSQNAKIFATTESGIGGTESSIDDIDGIGAILLNSLNSLSVNNSKISASTENGEAGYININAANSVELIGEGGLSVQASQGGIAGSITVNTNQFTIGDEAKVTVSSPSGQAGNLEITANDLFLDRGRLTAETGIGDSAEGANITLTIQDLLRMDNESLISAEAFGTANGGNITINNPEGFVIGLSFENSDISANANEGNGGNIDITTHNIFGLIFREQKTSESDITASSKFGVNGQVTVNQLSVDPISGLVELPSNLEGKTKIKSGCAAARGNNFIVSGKGGLPQSPDDLFTGEIPNTELFDLVPSNSQISSNISPSNRNLNAENHRNQVPERNLVLEKNKIVEATGLVFDADGNVELVAQIPKINSHNSGIYSVSCKDFSPVSK